MRTRDLVRTVVLKTNPYWPFSQLNRAPYYLAIKAFISLCKRYPEIKSVYLRHGLLDPDWVPGVSDIDLTVIFDGDLNTGREYDFLCSFWERYDRFKRSFPMLGEISLLRSNHIHSWTQFGIRGYQATNWRLLYGEPTVKSHYRVDARMLAIDSFNYALGVYLQHLIVRFYDTERSAFLVCREMQRLLAKILRYINAAVGANSIFQQGDEGARSRTEILCLALFGLEEGAKRMARLGGSARENADEEWQNELDFDQLPFNGRAEFRLEELKPARGTVESVLETYNINFVIVNDKAGQEKVRTALDTIRSVFPRHGVTPIIASPAVFDFMLRFYDPYGYTGLRRHRAVHYGKDILRIIDAPSKVCFVNAIMGQTQNVLGSSCSRALFMPNDNGSWLKMWSSLMERSLRIKLYKEKASVLPLYGKLLEECGKSYPEYCRAIRNAQTSGAGAPKITPESFELLRSMADEINSRVKNSA